ncbi:MAG: hypothetical protein FWD61_00420 [Phycisphaerales bacterium]|nr:hypothetical protein [Phycisphaerales bacterium]
MATVVTEKFESRQATMGDNESVELAYNIAGSDDDAEVRAALVATSPVWFCNLIRQSATVEPVGEKLWEGRVRYGMWQKQPPAGESVFSFDTGGGMQHITQSRQTVGRYPNNAPDFGGAIGVTHDAVEGVDISIPIYQFSETHYFPAAVVTWPYRGQLFYLTGKVNSASFRGCAAGECLFLGASGSRRTQGQSIFDGDWEISFKFAASPNATGLRVGTISGINKRGWEYMWVRYQDAEDENANELIKKPVAVYIERVYDTANFAGLGIGS